MPALSRAERLARLSRELLSPERWVDALLVVVAHDGRELFRCGGLWDVQRRAYVTRPDREPTPHVVRLQESQLEIGEGFARWLDACRRGDSKRPRVIVAGGNRGSGKTWFCALVIVAVALEWPGSHQMGVNITAKNRRECVSAIGDVAPPKWIAGDVTDMRDPRTEFLTGAVVQWMTSQNPRALRQAGLPIRNVFVNEGQDQGESVYINAQMSTRNTGGIVTIATNPPQSGRGDWTAMLWHAIEAEEVNGARYFLDNKLNRAIDQDAVDDIADLVRAVSREAAEADADGVFHLSGNLAYPAFNPLPLAKGGHVGEPPQVGWTDVTRELTAEALGSDSGGTEYVAGVDFQRQPGCVADIAKLYRDERGRIILHVTDVICVRGVEPDLSQALVAAGYYPIDRDDAGERKASLLIVGDGTGARQNAEHKKHQPPSFTILRGDGWRVVPPMFHWKNKTPWNPYVKDSRAQMHAVLSAGQILISPRCREANSGFPSLVESLRSAKVTPRGALVENGNFQHAADGVRYLAWKFLPRPKPATPSGIDSSTFDELRKVRLFGGA